MFEVGECGWGLELNCCSLAFLGDVQEFLFVHQLALNSNLFVYFEFTTGVYRCLESWKSRNSKSHFSRP